MLGNVTAASRRGLDRVYLNAWAGRRARSRRLTINPMISMKDLEADDDGIRFNVDLDGSRLRAHVSYARLLGRSPTREEKALPPKYLFEARREDVQRLVYDALASSSTGRVSLIIG